MFIRLNFVGCHCQQPIMFSVGNRQLFTLTHISFCCYLICTLSCWELLFFVSRNIYFMVVLCNHVVQ